MLRALLSLVLLFGLSHLQAYDGFAPYDFAQGRQGSQDRWCRQDSLPKLVMNQRLTAPIGAICDPTTGLCTPAPVAANPNAPTFDSETELIYIGDPMCSWCWGISPALNRLQRAAEANGIGYRIVLGGLRPDDSEQWNQQFKDFLAHHWEEVNARSGQPFGKTLFEAEHFQYNTEPSCRAVVAARSLDPAIESRFFELTQYRFYVLGEDPKQVKFYLPICEELDLDFARFAEAFKSEAIKQATQTDFALNRQWGVTGYPTVVLRTGNQLHAVARGFATFDQMWQGVTRVLE